MRNRREESSRETWATKAGKNEYQWLDITEHQRFLSSPLVVSVTSIDIQTFFSNSHQPCIISARAIFPSQNDERVNECRCFYSIFFSEVSKLLTQALTLKPEPMRASVSPHHTSEMARECRVETLPRRYLDLLYCDFNIFPNRESMARACEAASTPIYLAKSALKALELALND